LIHRTVGWALALSAARRSSTGRQLTWIAYSIRKPQRRRDAGC